MRPLRAAFLLLATRLQVVSSATVMDRPLPYNVYNIGSNCTGEPIASGVTSSIAALGDGAFCEVSNLLTPEEAFTKIIVDSCDAIDLFGYISVTTYDCADSACSACDGVIIQADVRIPEFDPLPSLTDCWETLATSTGFSVLNHFGPEADPEGVSTYWKVLFENSCLSDTMTLETISEDPNEESEAPPTETPKAEPMVTTPDAASEPSSSSLSVRSTTSVVPPLMISVLWALIVSI